MDDYNYPNKYCSSLHKPVNLLSVVFACLVLCWQISFAQEDEFIERRESVWAKFAAYGVLSQAKGIQYMIEILTRYSNAPNIFNELFFRPAIYYYTHPNLSFWLGYALRNNFPQGESQGNDPNQLENRIWEQVSWNISESDDYLITSRTRLEQRELTTDPQWAWRFRQKQSIKLYHPKLGNIIPYISDEILLNLNNPIWVGERFVDENRFFVGFEIAINQFTKYEIRYLNQIDFGVPKNRVNHIVYLKISTRI